MTSGAACVIIDRMRTCLAPLVVLPLLCAACAPSTSAVELNTAALNANTSALDRIIADGERAAAAPKPEAQRPPEHVVCRAGKLAGVEAVEKGEKDLGAASKCPAPYDDVTCVGGRPASKVAADCEAGKL